MSWIKDVAHELKQLDVSRKSLRNFGVTIGIVFLIIGIFFIWQEILENYRVGFIACGLLLSLLGLVSPKNLLFVYKSWMSFAFAIGWIVSRFILIILFIFVVTPLGIMAKLFRKKFLALQFRENVESYWINKEHKIIDYEKMY
jgi:hypothetical protein